MKILILSDLHQEFGSPFKAPAVDYDVVILAGDVDCPASRAVAWAARPETFPGASAVIYVAGNHEFYGHAMEPVLRNMKTQAQGSFVHALDASPMGPRAHPHQLRLPGEQLPSRREPAWLQEASRQTRERSL